MLSGSDNAGACRLLLGRIGLVLHVVAMLQHEQGTAQAAISTSPPCNISFVLYDQILKRSYPSSIVGHLRASREQVLHTAKD